MPTPESVLALRSGPILTLDDAVIALKVDRKDVWLAFQELQKRGFGTTVIGRRGGLTRFVFASGASAATLIAPAPVPAVVAAMDKVLDAFANFPPYDVLDASPTLSVARDADTTLVVNTRTHARKYFRMTPRDATAQAFHEESPNIPLESIEVTTGRRCYHAGDWAAQRLDIGVDVLTDTDAPVELTEGEII